MNIIYYDPNWLVIIMGISSWDDDPDARMERLDRFDEEQVGLQILIQLRRLKILRLIIIGHDTTWIFGDDYFVIIIIYHPY